MDDYLGFNTDLFLIGYYIGNVKKDNDEQVVFADGCGDGDFPYAGNGYVQNYHYSFKVPSYTGDFNMTNLNIGIYK